VEPLKSKTEASLTIFEGISFKVLNYGRMWRVMRTLARTRVYVYNIYNFRWLFSGTPNRRAGLSRTAGDAMAFIPCNQVVEAVLRFTLGGQNVNNVLNFLCSTTVTPTNMVSLGSAIIESFVDSSWWGNDVAGIDFQDVKLTDLTTISGPVVIQTSSATHSLPLIPTAHTDDVIPNNAALVVSAHTANRGRSFRGRTYLSGIRNAQTASTVAVISATAGRAVELFNDIFSAAVLVNYTPVVLSRFTGGAPRLAGVATNITSYSCNVNLDSQRRRLAN